MSKQATLEKITAWAKRRGFVYPSSEIYGGLANTWDWGPYGAQLKKNVADLWWNRFIVQREDIVGIDASIILNPEVWKASGHTESFADALIDCKNCKTRTRADHLIEDNLKDIKVEGLPNEELSKIIKENKLKCPNCGKSDWTDARDFNQLFETHIGIVPENKSLAYLRGEIAQGLFLNFKNVLDSMRVKLPFGIAQQGKAFRNEITKGQLVHRTLEFDLMEFEYFIKEEEWEKSYKYWEEQMWHFALDLGIKETNIRWREHEEFERSHYSTLTKDIEYEYPFGFKEMFGLAYRTNFDLSNHMKTTGVNLEYRDPQTNEKFIPHVVEPTFGLSRLTGVLLFDSYNEEDVNGKTRIVMRFNSKIAPVQIAIFPLQKDAKLRSKAREIFDSLKQNYRCEFDDAGNIGKMYRRQDEIGTPWCVTIDFETLEKDTVTIRDRDTMEQERVGVNNLNSWFEKELKN